MKNPERPDIRAECPCCGATLTIDATLGKVIAHDPPRRTTNQTDLGQAEDLLRQQAEKREAIFRKSTEDEKVKSRLLERKFEEALKKSKDEPLTKPTRDIDL